MARRPLVRDVTLVAVAATVVALLPTAHAAVLYEIRWWSLVTLSRYVHDAEQETERGERRGRGVMVYEPPTLNFTYSPACQVKLVESV